MVVERDKPCVEACKVRPYLLSNLQYYSEAVPVFRLRDSNQRLCNTLYSGMDNGRRTACRLQQERYQGDQ